MIFNWNWRKKFDFKEMNRDQQRNLWSILGRNYEIYWWNNFRSEIDLSDLKLFSANLEIAFIKAVNNYWWIESRNSVWRCSSELWKRNGCYLKLVVWKFESNYNKFYFYSYHAIHIVAMCDTLWIQKVTNNEV